MGVNIERIVACFDGTWKTDKSNTNVSRLFRRIADETTGCLEQRHFYDEGVGTRWGERIRGGMLGIGLDANIRQGYAWLAAQYKQADPQSLDAEQFVSGPRIFLFGFSRGAFTARSLGGLINHLGLPKLGSLSGAKASDSPQDDPLVKQAWGLYAARPTPEERTAAAKPGADTQLKQRIAEYDEAADAHRKQHAYYPVRIHFLGVWDTVGALGIPRVFDDVSLGRPSSKYRFHDTKLGRCVRYAYHAVAIDEHREPYCVTLWGDYDKKTTQVVKQRWFPGAHADVGGGYDDNLLPDPPLAWIAAEAADKGLHFIDDRSPPDAHGKPKSAPKMPAAFELDGREYLSAVHDSYAAFLGGTYRLLRSIPGVGGRAYRRMLVDADGVCQEVDTTANLKVTADSHYRPPNLSQAGRFDISYNVARLDDE